MAPSPRRQASGSPRPTVAGGRPSKQVSSFSTFHCEILNNHEALKREQEGYKEIPVVRMVDNAIIQRNYLQIKQDVEDILQSEMERLLKDPGQEHLVVRKGE